MHHVKVGAEARKEMLDALVTISEAVGSTLGPYGMPFAYDRIGADMRWQATFSKDGLTVIRSLGFKDPATDAVLQYCKQSAAHSVLASGDGTTSTIVLAAAVAKAIANSQTRMPPQAFARHLEREARRCIEAIKAEAIKGDEVVHAVALTSVNGDEELAQIAIDAVSASSAFGTIVTEKNAASKVRYQITVQDGYCHCAGYDYNNTLALSASEKAASNEAIEWANPFTAIFNGHLLYETQLDPIIRAWNDTLVSGMTRNLVIFAYELSDDVANRILVMNRTLAKQGVGVFVVKPRLSSETNSGLHVIRDIAAFTGTEEKFIIDGGNYKAVTAEFLGTCDKVKITPTETVLMGRAVNHWVERRVEQNLSLIRESRVQHDKEVTAIRNSQLTEGLVKVIVGDGLAPDLQERADRLEDANKAVQSAMQFGALPGCGASYVRAAELAGAGPELTAALATIHKTIMGNFGLQPVTSFQEGESVRIGDEAAVRGQAMMIKVLDATETVCAVIKNGVDLGIRVATLGGYSLRDKSNGYGVEE
jgi:chaperonin GroEL (HSP60 family)